MDRQAQRRSYVPFSEARRHAAATQNDLDHFEDAPGALHEVGHIAAPARPVSPPRPASAAIKGFISTPGDLYGTPPAVVLRSYGGFAEGQLQYQFGKVSPLLPSFSPSWLRNPPQREAVTDLRLQPSQRAASCYAPEWLQLHASFPDSAPNTRPATAASPASPIRQGGSPPRVTVPARPDSPPRTGSPLSREGPSSPPRAGSPPGTAPEYVGSGPSRPLAQKIRPHTAAADLGASASGQPAFVLMARNPSTPGQVQLVAQVAASGVEAPPSRWGGKTRASYRTYNRTGWGGGPHAAVHWVGTAAGRSKQAAHQAGSPGYCSHIQKGLAHSPLTDMLRVTAKSSFENPFPTGEPTTAALVRRASRALGLSRSQSRIVQESQTLAAVPKRHTHHPRATEGQERMAAVVTSEPPPPLAYMERLQKWGR